jgi:2-octaprenyl-6-methoxyphenol hydroxylase
MLDALGLWEGLADHAQPILEIKASDGRAGEGAAPHFLHFDHSEIEEGPMGQMLEDRYLRRALIEAMERRAADHPHAGGDGRRAGHRRRGAASRWTMAAASRAACSSARTDGAAAPRHGQGSSARAGITARRRWSARSPTKAA